MTISISKVRSTVEVRTASSPTTVAYPYPPGVPTGYEEIAVTLPAGQFAAALDKATAAAGTAERTGQKIAEMGIAGDSTSTHRHFEVSRA